MFDRIVSIAWPCSKHFPRISLHFHNGPVRTVLKEKLRWQEAGVNLNCLTSRPWVLTSHSPSYLSLISVVFFFASTPYEDSICLLSSTQIAELKITWSFLAQFLKARGYAPFIFIRACIPRLSALRHICLQGTHTSGFPGLLALFLLSKTGWWFFSRFLCKCLCFYSFSAGSGALDCTTHTWMFAVEEEALSQSVCYMFSCSYSAIMLCLQHKIVSQPGCPSSKTQAKDAGNSVSSGR